MSATRDAHASIKKKIVSLTSSTHGGSRFNRKTECFTTTVESSQGKPKLVRLKGLVPALRDHFFPDFVFTGSRSGGVERAPIVGNAAETSKTKGTARAGMKRGKLVDATISKCVETSQYTPKCRATRHIFAALKKMGLSPILTQVPAHGMSKGLRVGTAIDVVCVNEANGVVLVEVKTGYSNTWEKGTGPMKKPLNSMSNCPQHQHMLQLALTSALFTMTTGIKVADAFVVRVIQSGVHYVRVSPEIQSALPSVMRVLSSAYS
jgi:hypothetical protein